MDNTKEGWGWPARSKKAHYFVDSRSLCLKWLYMGDLDSPKPTQQNPGPSDCVACHKKLSARHPPDQKGDQKIKG